MRRRNVVIALTGLALVVVLAVVLFHDAAVLALLRGIAQSAGYRVSADRFHLGLTSLSSGAIAVENTAGEPVFDARSLDVQFSLRDLLPGSQHRFGLRSVDIERPQVTLIHHPDGSYNIKLPAGSSTPQKPDTTPIALRARIRDGSVVLIDRFVSPQHERRQRIVGLQADVALAPHTHSYYDVRFDLNDGVARYPVRGKATFESDRGFDAQRWTAARLPIGPLVDFALPSHAIDLASGELRGLDARIYTFVDRAGTARTHIGVRADLAGATIFVAQLAKPVRDAHGTVLAYDDGITTTGIDATLAGARLHVAGGLYDLTSAPSLRFELNGRGHLDQLRTLAAAAARQPLHGELAFAARVSGPLAKPVIRGWFAAPSVDYGAYHLSSPSGALAFIGTQLQILDARTQYGPLMVIASGTLDLQRHVGTDLIATIAGPGDAIPYAGAVVPHLTLNGVVHLSGVDSRLASRGILFGDAPRGSLDAPFVLDANGNGVIGPLMIARADGASIYARAAFDRAHNSISAIADVRRFSLAPARAAALPGLSSQALPPIAGTLDAQVAASIDGGRIAALSGHLRGSHLRSGSIAVDRIVADASGADDTARLTNVRATGPLGTFGGAGAYRGGTVVFDGRYDGSFEQLKPFVGAGARGSISAPIRAAYDGTTTLVQLADARFGDATVRGVTLTGASATIGVRPNVYDIYAARAGVAGGTVTAQGRFGNGGQVLLTLAGVDVRRLRAAGVPLDAGQLVAIAHVDGTAAAPRGDLGVALAGGRYAGNDAQAEAIVVYDGRRLTIRDATVVAAGAYATASGEVTGLDPAHVHPSLDVNAHLRGAQIATIAKTVKTPLRYPEGELDADVHVAGAASAPRVAGGARIAAGSLNGLAFRNADVPLAGDMQGIDARGGRVTVGTTTLGFDAAISRARQHVALRAPRMDLADFNDYFDEAETLAGRGHARLAATLSRDAIVTNGDVALRDVRYRRFIVGDTNAQWTTDGRTIGAVTDIGGTNGRIHAGGTLRLPATEPLRAIAQRGTIAANARIAGLNLGTWLPAAGIVLPVAGIIDADARASGSPGAPAYDAHAALQHGLVAGYPITMATLAAAGDRRSTRISALHVAGPALDLAGTGTFGYQSTDPVALALHAQSDNVGALAKALGVTVDAAGAATIDARVAGSRNAPRLTATADVRNGRYLSYTVSRIHADLDADRRHIALRNGEADLARGRILLAASAPISISPFAIAPGDQTITADVRAEKVDVAQFAALLPKDNHIAGVIDGTLGVRGSTAHPQLGGTLTLAGGAYSSSQVRSPIKNATLRVDLANQRFALTTLHADVGAGAIDGSGSGTLGDVRDLAHTLTFDATLSAKKAGLDIARLIKGTINGDVTATQTRGGTPLVAGTLSFSDTRIPLTALLPSAPPNAKATAAPLPVGFGLNIVAGNNVRIQSGNVDIGARGNVLVGGTLAKPTLDGRFTSTDGTLSFYRTFVLQRGEVAFSPDAGFIPNVDATATTHITNPDTEILLHVTGPATAPNLQLASEPNYDQSQIVGLLVNAQALGAVSGVQTSQAGGGSAPSVTSLAGGYLSQQFTRGLLQPLSGALGQSLGFESVAIGYDFGSGLSTGFKRQLGKNLTASFNQSFGADQRQSLAFDYNLRQASALQFTLFSAGTATTRTLGQTTPFAPAGPTNFTLQALSPPPGSSGYVFTFVRRFWAKRGQR